MTGLIKINIIFSDNISNFLFKITYSIIINIIIFAKLNMQSFNDPNGKPKVRINNIKPITAAEITDIK